MEFIKYPSLTNTYKEDFLLSVQLENENMTFDNWIVTEKIHGANFAIHYDPKKEDDIRVASRNQFVGTDFFNNDAWIEPNKDKLISMFKTIVANHDYATLKIAGKKQSEVVQIITYGELFGKGINKGVEYPKGRHFLMFDIMVASKIIRKGKNSYVNKEFMDWDQVDMYGDTSKIPTVPVLFKGTLKECLAFNPEVISIAGELVDDDFVSGEDNFAEGVVIRPNETFHVRCERAILKNKIEKFKEKNRTPKKKREHKSIFLEFPDLLHYITANRLDNVLSKEGPVQDLNFQYVVQMFIIDIIDEFCKDNEFEFEDKDELKRVKKGLGKDQEVVSLVRKAFGFT